MPLNIVLVHPEIPHNTGAIGRLCVGLDARLHLIRPLGFVLGDPWIRRAGLDYWEHLALTVHDSWDDFLSTIAPRRLHIASTRGRRDLFACTFEPDACLVFGNESAGLPSDWYARYSDDLFRIPMPGAHARSINLANAVAIVAYEAWRQTHATHTGPGTDPIHLPSGQLDGRSGSIKRNQLRGAVKNGLKCAFK